MPERVYFNRMQREVLQVDANTSVVVAGRGTGKAKAAVYFALAAVYRVVWRMLNKQTKSDYVQEQG